MEIYSIYKQMSEDYFNSWTKRYYKFTPDYKNHLREDYHLVSEKHPICVVADGVTLKRDREGNYPISSGAYELAKIFCETIIKEAESRYDIFNESLIQEIFDLANRKAFEFNNRMGRTIETTDYREFDLFASTASFVLIKETDVYWFSIHDSAVMALDFVTDTGVRTESGPREFYKSFTSPEAWPDEKEKIASLGDKELSDIEFNELLKRTFRNKVDGNGERLGYGVVTGERTADKYLNFGKISTNDYSDIVLYTDGFEDYFKNKEFLDFLCKSDFNDNIDFNNQMDVFYKKISQIDPIKYGRERTLIYIKIK
jgi:hypothetical protein